MAEFDSLWAFDKPIETREKFQTLLAEIDAQSSEAAEVMTQIARTYSLTGEFGAAHALLDRVEAMLGRHRPIITIRYLLERGRTLRSAGEAAASIPLFEEAFALAQRERQDFYAIDAAHMLALVLPGEEQMAWHKRGLQMAAQSADVRAQKWQGSLANNLAWTLHERGEFAQALAYFEQALQAFEGYGSQEQIWIARWAIGRTYRSLNRIDEAIDVQKAILIEREQADRPDGYVHEELAECYLLQTQMEAARQHFAAAHSLLAQDEWLQKNESERLQRLQTLAKD